MDNNELETSADVDASYQKVVDVIKATVKKPMSDDEAQEAARNVIGFYKTLLSIHMNSGEQEREKLD